ncbi:MAG TPA: hypothetical protein VIK84_03630 [Haloplasmataceae bacterium]
MKKFFQWIYSNKVTLTGFLALILYILDQIFKFSKNLNLSDEVYYGIASIIVFLIGYAIKGRGFESIEEYKLAVEKHKKWKEAMTLQEKVEVLNQIVEEKETKEENSK